MAGEYQNSQVPTMDNQDYPSLFQGADTAAAPAQKTYFLLQQIYLSSLIMGGLFGMHVYIRSWLAPADLDIYIKNTVGDYREGNHV
jgi:hypothetical protein